MTRERVAGAASNEEPRVSGSPKSTFPAPPLKFRTSGFPQYGFKPRFNRDLHDEVPRLSARPACARYPAAYTRLKSMHWHPVARRHVWRLPWHGLLGPEALGSPGGSVVLPARRLLWPHPRLSPASIGLFSSSDESLPCGLVWAAGESFPNLSNVSVPPRHLPYPGWLAGCTWSFLHRPRWPCPSLHRLGAQRSDALRVSALVCVTRLQSSLHATARWMACPSPERAFTYELPSLESPPSRRRI